MSMIRRNLGSIAVLVGGVALALLIAAIGPRTQPISQALQPVARAHDAGLQANRAHAGYRAR